MLDKKKIKEKLESERDRLVAELGDMGKLNPETLEWEAMPEAVDRAEADQNDAADRFEDFEERSSLIRSLGPRLNNILRALKNLHKDSFGVCEVCREPIEADRLEANPAATTCKAHVES